MFRVVRLAEEQVPKSELAGFDFEVLYYRNDGLPALDRVGRDLRMGDFARRYGFVLSWL